MTFKSIWCSVSHSTILSVGLDYVGMNNLEMNCYLSSIVEYMSKVIFFNSFCLLGKLAKERKSSGGLSQKICC